MSLPVASILTLGCKLNLADSEQIARGLRKAGYEVVDHLCEADAYVVNTCSVTHVADRKARRLIRAVQRMNPEATVAVTGCYPQTAGADSVTTLGAHFVAGTRDSDKEELVEFLAARKAQQPGESPVASPPAMHTRRFIKAQEGCNDVCAFCIVPWTRGREESRTPVAVAAEVREATAEGTREVVITGTQLGAWGRDFETPLKPRHLISHLLETTEVPRIRFSSLQPQDITPELLALWSDPRLMPHFHLALQSGSEHILRSMRRRYTVDEFRRAARFIASVVPHAAITTDVIAGFPGETEADFEDTIELCREVGFARIHAFPYSVRQRTGAARLSGQIPDSIRKERLGSLISLGDELREQFRGRFEGTARPVLWEEVKDSTDGPLVSGLTDNYIRVYLPGTGQLNRITTVRLGPAYHDGTLGLEADGGDR